MAVDVSELVEKYGLPEEVVRDEIERAITMSLTSKLGRDVEGFFNENSSFIVRVFRDSLTGVKAEWLRGVPRSAFVAAKKTIERNLHERAAVTDNGRFSYLANTLVHGTVFNINSAGVLYVRIKTVAGEDVIGTCSLRHQPPRERGTYVRGDRLPFYVLKVRAASEEDGISRLEIPLSRTSRRFVELLLEREAGNPDARIKCVKRIVGSANVVHSNRYLPRDTIKRVSDELGERIKVRWSSGF